MTGQATKSTLLALELGSLHQAPAVPSQLGSCRGALSFWWRVVTPPMNFLSVEVCHTLDLGECSQNSIGLVLSDSVCKVLHRCQERLYACY